MNIFLKLFIKTPEKIALSPIRISEVFLAPPDNLSPQGTSEGVVDQAAQARYILELAHLYILHDIYTLVAHNHGHRA